MGWEKGQSTSEGSREAPCPSLYTYVLTSYVRGRTENWGMNDRRLDLVKVKEVNGF